MTVKDSAKIGVIVIMITGFVNIQSARVFGQTQTDQNVFQNLPKAKGYRFRCGAMAILVNQLRSAGKDEAIRLLGEYNDATQGVFNNELVLGFIRN